MFIEGSIIPTPDPSPRGRGDVAGRGELIVPRSAVLWTGERSLVYVELPDTEVPTYEFREVTVGERVGEGVPDYGRVGRRRPGGGQRRIPN